MTTKPALLALADGQVFEGIAVGASGDCVGELVFNTSMTGYQEILTDPSYAKQIVTLTAAHVGNTGCNEEDDESSRVWASGLVVRHCSKYPSNYRSTLSLPEWLKKKGVVAIAGIDTRYLTIQLREYGAIGACISTEDTADTAIEKARAFQGLDGLDLASKVSRHAVERWHSGRGSWGPVPQPLNCHLVAYDFGMKANILRILHDKGCHITLVPAQTTADAVLDLNPDGIVLSNGPGDPAACDYAIAATQTFLKKGIPVLGICLGFQILGLALGAKTLKMKFGHHGANHPVLEMDPSQRVYITSQNHGFAIDENTLPADVMVTHRSLFDQSLQGFAVKSKKAFGFQGHPEAGPGPHDIETLFEQFMSALSK